MNIYTTGEKTRQVNKIIYLSNKPPIVSPPITMTYTLPLQDDYIITKDNNKTQSQWNQVFTMYTVIPLGVS